FKFGGKADRVESRQGVPHVIDYKTGGVNQSDLTIKEIEDLSGVKYKPKFVQLLMYAWLTSVQLKSDRVVSGIYTLRKSELELLKAKLNNQTILGKDELDQFEQFVTDKVREMLNPEIDLERNPDYQFAVF
ncbi:MAG: ATP-dependent helicase/nuclease subunit B, partial [Dokdonia sp.]